MNTSIDNLTTQEALSCIDSMIAEKKKGYIVTPNVDHIVMLEQSEAFQKAYSNASLVLVDGTPLMWAAKYYKEPFKEKICGPDFTSEVLSHAERSDQSVFFLGGLGETSELAFKNAKKKWPNLKIVGYCSPAMGFLDDKSLVDECLWSVNAANPNILILGLGSPKQEFFALEFLDQLDVNVILCVGAAIDFIAGTASRAPIIMRKVGLEWLYRLIKEPKRLWRRYRRDFGFFRLVFKYRND